MLEILTHSTWADRIGWVLVHSLWQFAFLAVVAAGLQWALHRCTSATRYRALLVAMCALVALPVATWFWTGPAEVPVARADARLMEEPQERGSWRPTRVQPPQYSDDMPASEARPAPAPVERTEPLPPEPDQASAPPVFCSLQETVQPWLPEIVLIWLAGVLLAALRPLFSWYTVHRLKTVGISPVGEAVQVSVERTAARLGVTRAVRVLQSTLVRAPVVVGHFRPAILLPLCVLTGLPEPQLELILAHELAHIRRNDYLVNLLQTLIETFFFYHPAVWWLSRQIRNERENCCDDAAMALGASRVDYGRALLAVEQLRVARAGFALAAGGGSLVGRIRRIAGCGPAPRIVGGGSILGVVLASLVLLAGVTRDAAPAIEKPEQPAATATTPAATAETPRVFDPDTSYTKLAFPDIAKRIGLSDEQRARVAALLIERVDSLQKVAGDTKAELKVKLDYEQRLSQVLTSQQQADWPEKVLRRTLRFDFRYQLWADVLEWYAEEAGLALVMNSPPPGTFNYSDARQYTPEEAMDVLNSVLLTRGFTLIKRDKLLIVLNVSQRIPDGLAPQIEIDDLANHGEFEFVTVHIPFGEQDATSLLSKLQAIKGAHGKIVPLPDERQLQITDTARNVRAMAALIEENAESPATEKADDLPSPKLPKSVTIPLQPGAEWHMEEIRRAAGDQIAAMTPTVYVPAMLSFQVEGQTITRPVELIGIDPETTSHVWIPAFAGMTW